MKRSKLVITSLLLIIVLLFSVFGFENSVVSSASDNDFLNPIKSIILSKNNVSLTVGKKTVITPKITYTNDKKDTETYSWKSDDKSVATISKNNIVTAISNGTTYVTCSSKSNSVKVRCKILVRNPYNKVSSISFLQKNIRLEAGDKRVLTPSIKFSDSNNYTTEPIEWTSSNTKVAKVSGKGVVKGKQNGTTTISIKSKISGKKASVKLTVGPTKYVAFTFDDGPGVHTKRLVDALVKNDSKATFFTLGRSIRNHKDELKYEASHGMEVASHTFNHLNLKKCSKKKIKSEINNNRKIIKDTIGSYPTLLRPPYGNYNKTVLKNSQAPLMYWSVDTLDWKHKQTKYVTKSVLRQSKKWSVVLLHDIHKTSVNGFIKALPKLKSRNYELVTVSELYYIYGKKMKPGVVYYSPIINRH